MSLPVWFDLGDRTRSMWKSEEKRPIDIPAYVSSSQPRRAPSAQIPKWHFYLSPRSGEYVKHWNLLSSCAPLSLSLSLSVFFPSHSEIFIPVRVTKTSCRARTSVGPSAGGRRRLKRFCRSEGDACTAEFLSGRQSYSLRRCIFNLQNFLRIALQRCYVAGMVQPFKRPETGWRNHPHAILVRKMVPLQKCSHITCNQLPTKLHH
jgi:hypothetical protein